MPHIRINSPSALLGIKIMADYLNDRSDRHEHILKGALIKSMTKYIKQFAYFNHFVKLQNYQYDVVKLVVNALIICDKWKSVLDIK